VTVRCDNASIQFTAAGTSYLLSVPSGSVTFSPTATTATTVFDVPTNTWQTTVPAHLGGNTFLTGLSFPVASNIPGGVNPVTWTCQLSSDTPGIGISWQWAAAVYTSFSTTNAALGVKPVDDNHASVYSNSDHAGTPENFKAFVIGGARGGGGSNFTGSYSGTRSAACP
jgi:hypothetical protein